MHDSSLIRIRLITCAIVFCALFLIARLYVVQVVKGEAFLEKADKQYIISSADAFNRGSIYAENADKSLVSLATLKSGYVLTINPMLIENSEEVYMKLSSVITEIDKEDFFAKASKKNDPYEEIAKRVESEVAERIEMLNLRGVYLYKERWRYYPRESLSAHVLGFVGFKDDVFRGQYGLEKYYNDALERSADDVYVNFFAEIFSNIPLLGKVEEKEADIITTILPLAQSEIEKEVKQIHETWQSKTTGGIIINPTNGEIVAMAAYPAFDPNTFNKEKNVGVFSNPLIESVYEMGSIIKPLTIAAGIDSGTITAKTTYKDNGFLTLNKATVYNFDKKGRGVVSIQEVLNQSLNTGAAFVADKMGPKFSEYMLSFGFGEETGIDLPNEAKGIVGNLEHGVEIDLATASYGHGIAMTPINITRALGSLANGGVLVTPHMVRRLEYSHGAAHEVTYEKPKRVMKETTAREVSRMLVEVVDKALLDGKVKMEHYSIAAKTGTALVSKVGAKGYYDDRYLHSFFGYFPASKPQFLIFLYTVEPQGVTYASHTLTTPFMDLTKYLINYFNIPPDR